MSSAACASAAANASKTASHTTFIARPSPLQRSKVQSNLDAADMRRQTPRVLGASARPYKEEASPSSGQANPAHRERTEQARSQHLVDVEFHRVLRAGAAGDGDGAVEPIDCGVRGLKAHDSAKIIARRVDRLAAAKRRQHFGR